MNKNTKNVLKAIANIAINSGASRFFTNIAVVTMPSGVGNLTKIVTLGAASLMGSMMGDMTYDYTMSQIENAKKSFKEVLDIDISEEDFENEEEEE